MEKHIPLNGNDALQIWMDHEYYKWTFKVKRVFDLVPPFINKAISIPQNICDLYSETRECYIAGNFRASIALSRSVLECCIKSKWNINPKREFKLGKKLQDLLRIGNLSRDLYYIADDINIKANEILHQGLPVDEKKALEFLDDTKNFIEGFHKK